MKYSGFIFLFFLSTSAVLNAQENKKSFENSTIVQPDSLALEKQLEQGKSLIKADSAKATRILAEVRNKASKAKLVFIEAAASIQLAGIYYDQELYHRAFGSYTNARNIYENNPGNVDMTELIIALARTQYHRGNYRLAVNNFVEALQLARAQNHKELEAEALENLGLLYNSFQGFNEGTAYYIKALKIKQSLDDEKGAVRVSQILGETYYRKRLFDSALLYSDLAYDGARKLGLKTEEYMAAINKAMSLTRLNNWNAADEILKSITGSIFNNQDQNRMLRYELAYGNLYLVKGDTANANYYYALAKKLAKDNSFPEMYALIYRNIAESYYELNDYRQAYENFRKHIDYISQLYSGRNLTNLGSLENIMNASTSKDEVRVLSLQNELKQNQLLKELLMREGLERENSLMDSIIRQEKNLSSALSRENIYKSEQLLNEKKIRTAEAGKLNDEKRLRYSLLAGLAAVLILGSVIFYQFRRQQKKRAIIEKQSEELQTLMKEIHHRVKNNLQVISSLLDLQSMTIADTQAAQAVKEGKNRVQSMAMIHQHLYNEGNIRGIEMKSFINNLAESLFHSYNIEPEKVQLKTSIEELNLDVDTVIPIGLILNELISNALKYAFKDQAKGTVEVILKKQTDNSLLLKVRDSGKGFDDSGRGMGTGSFGMKMINAFAQKLKAKLNIYNDGGACVEMQIQRYKTA